MNFIHRDLFAHKNLSFINNIYYSPIDVLLQMDKDRLRYSLAKAKLVCRGLEGILDSIADFEAINPKREGN